ncbi:hypothetical protein BJI49_07985 [Acetobacter pasteurianus]|nr:hypothetical protein BJI49_07985 [Acetobacter pasteurianus]GAB30002.1 hypothetical protein APS_0604 [Acetobacter pasteurianus subsp. pasteurianus LMG 1262 = NBRC 106471]
MKENKMSAKKGVSGAVLAVAITGLLGGCHEQHEENANRAVRPLRMPNPAAVYCVKKGGTLSTESTDKGQISYCHLPDGSVMEEWELFRRDNPAPKK